MPSPLTHSGRSEVHGPSHGPFARCLETFWLAMPSRLTHSGRSEVRDPTHGLFVRCLESFRPRLAMSSYPSSNCGSLIGSLIVICCLFSGLWHGHIRGLQWSMSARLHLWISISATSQLPFSNFFAACWLLHDPFACYMGSRVACNLRYSLANL